MKTTRNNSDDVKSESALKMSKSLVRYTQLQLDQMYEVFKRTQKPNAVDILELKKSTGLSDMQIRVSGLTMKIIIRQVKIS